MRTYSRTGRLRSGKRSRRTDAELAGERLLHAQVLVEPVRLRLQLSRAALEHDLSLWCGNVTRETLRPAVTSGESEMPTHLRPLLQQAISFNLI